jgi:multisubunit Na+/H+ antiporter MnhF subunit
MNAWLWAATALLPGFAACLWVCYRGGTLDRLIAFEVLATIETLFLLLLAEGYQQPSFYDLALTLAFLGFGGGMVFARMLERWL